MPLIAAQPYYYDLPADGLALVIIDMHRDFLEPGGFGEALGNDVSRLQTIIPTVQKLRQVSKSKGLLVIHTKEGHREDLADCPPAKLNRGQGTLKIGDEGPMGRILVLGEPGNGDIPELHPRPQWVGIAKP